jgi:hypothetical protein
VGQQSGHTHDFNPGIAPSGLFWTAHIPANMPLDSVQIDLGATTASLRLQDFSIGDTIPVVTPPTPATVTLDMEWSGQRATVSVRDVVNGFAGNYSECTATIVWSASEQGFTFLSDQASTVQTRFAEIGRERNGIFFAQGETD